MTIRQLHHLTGALVATGRGDLDVMVNTATFCEHEEACIFELCKVEIEDVVLVDDSGPTGDEEKMLVLKGGHDE